MTSAQSQMLGRRRRKSSRENLAGSMHLPAKEVERR